MDYLLGNLILGVVKTWIEMLHGILKNKLKEP